MARVTKIYDESGKLVGRTRKQHGFLRFVALIVAVGIFAHWWYIDIPVAIALISLTIWHKNRIVT